MIEWEKSVATPGRHILSESLHSPEELRAAAARHEAIARKYRELASLLEQEGATLAGTESETPEVGTSRKLLLYKTLLEKGPMTAKEIHDKVGMSLATIYFVAQDSRLFKKKGLHLHAVPGRGPYGERLSSQGHARDRYSSSRYGSETRQTNVEDSESSDEASI
jgi:hypothetical protein